METETDDRCDAQKVAFWFSKRFFVAVLMFFGTINTFALSANLNIAIVEMTSNKSVTLRNETITRVSIYITSPLLDILYT